MKNKNWLWGILFLALAVIITIDAIGYSLQVGIFSIIAGSVLLVIAVQNIVRLNYFGFFIPLALVIELFKKPLQIASVGLWTLLLIGLFLSIGFSILFKKKGGKHAKIVFDSDDFRPDDHKTVSDYESEDSDYIHYELNLGEANKYVHSNNLKSGYFECNLGKLNVYLEQATLAPEGANIKVECSLGQLTVYVSRGWNVITRIEQSMGSVQDAGSNADANGPKLIIDGEVSMGSIRIEYI